MMVAIVDGRVASDPEITTTKNGKEMVMFRVASERPWRDPQGNPVVDYYSISAFNRQAIEAVRSGALRRGTDVFVNGRGETWKQTTPDGASYSAFSIKTNDVFIRGLGNGQTEAFAPAPMGVPVQAAQAAQAAPAPLGVVDPFADAGV